MKHFLIFGVLFCLIACSQKPIRHLVSQPYSSEEDDTLKHKSVQSRPTFQKITPASYQNWLSQPFNKNQVLRYQSFLKNQRPTFGKNPGTRYFCNPIPYRWFRSSIG